MKVQVAVVCVDRKNRWVQRDFVTDVLKPEHLRDWDFFSEKDSEDFPIVIIPIAEGMSIRDEALKALGICTTS